MGSIFMQRPGETRIPSVTQLPEGRYRMQRFRVFTSPVVPIIPFGEFDTLELTGAEAETYGGMRLIRCEPGTLPDRPSVPATIDTYEQLTAYNDYVDMNVRLPGVRPSAYQVRDDFPFRANPTTKTVTVRVAHRFFVVSDPRRIPLIPTFQPVSNFTGDEVDVLTDDTSVTSDEYLGWVASRTEFVERCVRERVFGNVWVRKTYYVRAE